VVYNKLNFDNFCVFFLIFRYANALNLMFAIFMYGPAFPIFYPLGALAFFIVYNAEKYSFITHYAIPPHYDSALQSQFLSTMSFIIPLHTFMAIFVYTSPVTAAYDLEGLESLTQYFGPAFGAKISTYNALPSFLILASWIFIRGLNLLVSLCPFGCCDSDNETLGGKKRNKPTYWKAKRTTVLESYHMCGNLDYAFAYRHLKTDEYKQLPILTELFSDPFVNELGPLKMTPAEQFLKRSAHAQTAGKEPEDESSDEGEDVDDSSEEEEASATPRRTEGAVAAFQCVLPTCRQKFRIRIGSGRRQYQCPHCGTLMEVS